MPPRGGHLPNCRLPMQVRCTCAFKHSSLLHRCEAVCYSSRSSPLARAAFRVIPWASPRQDQSAPNRRQTGSLAKRRTRRPRSSARRRISHRFSWAEIQRVCREGETSQGADATTADATTVDATTAAGCNNSCRMQQQLMQYSRNIQLHVMEQSCSARSLTDATENDNMTAGRSRHWHDTRHVR